MRTSLPAEKLYSGARAEGLTVLALAGLLVGVLFWVPRSTLVSSQPWKMELFSSLFLIGLISTFLIRKKHSFQNSLALSRQFLIFLVLLLGFTVWSAVSAAWSIYPQLSVHHTLTWTIFLAVLMVFVYLCRSGSGIRILTGSFALTAIMAGIVCLIDYLTLVDFPSSEGLLRTRYAKFGEMMITISPVLAVMPFYIREKRQKLIAFTAAVLSWTVVMLSLSKGALIFGALGCLITFAGCAFFSGRSLRKRVLVTAACWAVLTIVFPIVFTALTSAPTGKDYIAGTAGNSSLSAKTRLLIWRTGMQMSRDNPVLGVGADNFGIVCNAARAEAASINPGNGPEIAEDLLLERAHNEFLQILDELGLVGLVLIIAAFFYFGWTTINVFRRNRWRMSPMIWASIGGMSAFFASSMVSSFSFRAIQNGIAFFLVSSIAVYQTGKRHRHAEFRYQLVQFKMRPILVSCSIAALLMLAYSGTKAVGEYYLYIAQRTDESEQAAEYIRTSLRIDPGNVSGYYALASRYASDENYGEAARLLSQGIDRGIGVSVTYSNLAKYQTLAGDPAAAERTLNDAISIFPRSVFLRVRSAVFLEDAGRPLEAIEQLRFARSIHPKQAAGWYQIIRNGSVAAYYAALADPNSAAPADLYPGNAVFDFLDEKKFPTPE